MEIYRLTPTRYAKDMEGTGAKLYGGRWNHRGVPCLYAAESRALCVVEYAVHCTAENLPPALSMITYLVNSDNCFTLQIQDLPENWRIYPAPDEVRDIGSALLREGKYLMIKVPSVAVPQEFNFFLNPEHKDFKKCVRIVDESPFEFDTRIKN